jgi:superfamily II DNA/RNA helicase
MNFFKVSRILNASFATKVRRTNASNTHRSSSVFTFSTRFPRKTVAPRVKSVAPRVKSVAPRVKKVVKKADPKKSELDEKRLQKIADHGRKFALFEPKVQDDQNIFPSIQESTLMPELKDALSNHFKFKNLCQVQVSALEKFSSSNDLVIASETGSGKTLAYLLPIFQELKRQESTQNFTSKISQNLSGDAEIEDIISSDISGILNDNNNRTVVRKPRQPRSIVLVPSRELVVQITKVAKFLSHYCRLVVCGFHSKMDPKSLKSNLEKPIDVMITTPGLLAKYVANRQFGFSETRFVVLDEADTLFDDGFTKELEPVIESVRKSSSRSSNNVKWIFSSATLPRRILKNIAVKFPVTDKIITKRLHRPLPVPQFFLRIDSSTTKHNLLLDTLKFEVVKEPRILIFCNTLNSCELVTTFLKSKGYDAFNISSSTLVQDRISIWDGFKEKGSIKDGCTIIVTTDLGSRGIDTLHCRSVILFDFPHTTIDYIHRAGRVGRMGRNGKVTSFVGKRDRRLADKIQLSIRKRQLLTE